MPTYTAPGVYVEEVPSSQKVLSAAPTAVAAFVGFTEKAPTDDPNDPEGLAPRLVTSWTQFESAVRRLRRGRVLPLSVYGYFDNGGSLAYIVRIPNTEPSGEPRRLALPAADRALGLPICGRERRARRRPRRIAIDAPTDADDARRPERRSPSRCSTDGEAVESLRRPRRSAPATATSRRSSTRPRRKVKVEVALADKTSTCPASSRCSSRAPTRSRRPPPTPVPVTGRKFAGSESARTGINGLAIADDVTMVIVPDLITAATKDDGTVDLGPVEGRADGADHRTASSTATGWRSSTRLPA